MVNETFASALRNKLGPFSTLIQIIEDIKPVSFNVEHQKLFEKSVQDAKESFGRIMETIQQYECENKSCWCGNPVDHTNIDCITFSLCKDHAADS